MGDSTDDILLELQPLVPTYHGVVHGEKNGSMAKRKLYIQSNRLEEVSFGTQKR
jgi:hypothetical protein